MVVKGAEGCDKEEVTEVHKKRKRKALEKKKIHTFSNLDSNRG